MLNATKLPKDKMNISPQLLLVPVMFCHTLVVHGARIHEEGSPLTAGRSQGASYEPEVCRFPV